MLKLTNLNNFCLQIAFGLELNEALDFFYITCVLNADDKFLKLDDVNILEYTLR